MENEILLKAIEKLLDQKLEPIKKNISELKSDVAELKSDVTELKSTQQTILAFVKEVDKEFYKVDETYKFMNGLKKVFNE